MDTEAFLSFYKTLNQSKFKYFVKDNAFYVQETDSKLIPPELLSDDMRSRMSSGIVKLLEIESIVRCLLLEKRIPVEEYVAGENSLWEVARVGHPSSYGDFADVCLSGATEPTLGAAIIVESEVSFAYVDNSTIKTTSFTDDDLYSGLYSLINVYNCTELLCGNPKMEKRIAGWGITFTRVANSKSIATMINNYLGKNIPVETFVRKDTCFVNIKDFDLADFGCVTAQGSRLLGQWLRSPCIKQWEINDRLDLTEAFMNIRVSLGECSDMRKLSVRVLNKRITIQECIRTFQMIELIPGFIEMIRLGSSDKNEKKLNESFICPLESVYNASGPFIAEVKEKICIETGHIFPKLTDELTRLNAEKEALCAEIEEEFLAVRAIYPRMKYQAKAFKVPKSDYVPEEFDRRHYVVTSVQKTGVFFLTASLASRRNLLSEKELEITTEEAKIFEEIRTNMLSIVNLLEVYNFVIALMDIYKTFSRKAILPSYTRPIFKDDEYQVTGFFHPLLENEDVVLNDLIIDNDQPKKLCILTGPNMGGKSTVLKSLSTVSLYAQIGCYVPAKYAVLPIFDKIFMRVGARDHSSAGLSTFMVEMVDLAKILKLATSKSLILIDELGRGTAALDGLSLILAVKEYLIGLGAFTVMATHFSEVGDNSTHNLRMAVSGGRVTYLLLPGVADHSFGLNVAQLAGFPESVLNSAKRYLNDYNDSL
ncbi:DNA mismatch repair protein MSH2 [Pancytospora epiphaga]|nr:DNA mismatch repair protein MSH2 [Pancytospora epiphaga]